MAFPPKPHRLQEAVLELRIRAGQWEWESKEEDLRASLSKQWAPGSDWKQMKWTSSEFWGEFYCQGNWKPKARKSIAVQNLEPSLDPWTSMKRCRKEAEKTCIPQGSMFREAHFKCVQVGNKGGPSQWQGQWTRGPHSDAESVLKPSTSPHAC